MAKDSNVNICLKQGGNSFGFYNTTLGQELEFTAEEMFWAMKEMKRDRVVSTLLLSTASTTITSPNIGSYAKWIRVSMTSNAVSLSAWLTSAPYLGAELWIHLVTQSCGSGTLLISCSGVSLVNVRGSDHSRMTLANSAASAGWVHLKCLADGCWSVVDSAPGSVTFT